MFLLMGESVSGQASAYQTALSKQQGVELMVWRWYNYSVPMPSEKILNLKWLFFRSV